MRLQELSDEKTATEEKLEENFNALMDAIVKAKPSALKGQYLRSITLASTMGPGVKAVSYTHLPLRGGREALYCQ